MIDTSSITKNFNQIPLQTVKGNFKEIFCFNTEFEEENIDHSVVESFGEEWKKFASFEDKEIDKLGKMYFDIIDENIVNKNTYGIDIGCGTGRWTKYLLDKIGFMEAIDPSEAIYTADKLIAEKENVRFSRASTDNIPFEDETFDFGMSIGVLHHIPDTQKAMTNCVKKIKKGGYFYVYLYYNLEDRSAFFKFILSLVSLIRKVVSSLPSVLKKFVCDLIAIFIYMPVILLGRFSKFLGLKKFALSLPLSFYQNQSFFVVRNDALDRFGTSLEQRFSRSEITEMMQKAGLSEVVISPNEPYYHAVGKKIN
ncbi:class I SAM-dependent methyltransferase [Bernardetia sp. ABR2-2B]|uniref:class I SAM-dependent methyltransferase n=1 Tax=Bernardetia sp. ABR2-2B TaxID=3127472 RepID=UPI0030CE7698